MKKIKFYKRMLIEVIETLASICLYLDFEGRRNHNKYACYMFDHYRCLTEYRKELRGKKNEHN